MRALIKPWAKWISGVAFVNLIAWMIGRYFLGGDALSGGNTKYGLFLVGGTYVTSTVYSYSWWHTVVTCCLTLLSVVIGLVVFPESLRKLQPNPRLD